MLMVQPCTVAVNKKFTFRSAYYDRRTETLSKNTKRERNIKHTVWSGKQNGMERNSTRHRGAKVTYHLTASEKH